MGNTDLVGDVRRLIVFDLDGTLIDSRQDLASSANALIVQRGGSPLPEDAIGRMVGDGAAMLVRRALDAAGLPLEEGSVARFLELYDARLLDTTRPYPGVRELLEQLAPEATMAVLTNKPLRPSLRLLDALGLAPFVATTIGGDGPYARKPDPEALHSLLTLHRSSPRAAVLVGDSHVDLETGRAAGVPVCLVRYGFGYGSVPPGMLRADETAIDAPSELPAAIERLLSRERT